MGDVNTGYFVFSFFLDLLEVSRNRISFPLSPPSRLSCTPFSSCASEIRELHARRLTFSISCEVGRCRKGKKERRREREREGEREGHSRPGEESTALHREKRDHQDLV